MGFGDTSVARRWTEYETMMVKTAAEMVSSALQRWQAEHALSTRERYQGALAQFSSVLLATPADAGQEREILNQALGCLLTGTQASRAYVAPEFRRPCARSL